MNFTKDYIELCKCKEMQGLRHTYDNNYMSWTKLFKGDWFYDYGKEDIILADDDYEFETCMIDWLPTGDQLDEEIVKICKPKQWMYQFWYENSFDYHALRIDARKEKCLEFVSDNPLIAKIKLLIQLKGM